MPPFARNSPILTIAADIKFVKFGGSIYLLILAEKGLFYTLFVHFSLILDENSNTKGALMRCIVFTELSTGFV